MVQGSGEFRERRRAAAVRRRATCCSCPRGVVHRFEKFTDDLAMWVMFYGPEGGEVPGELRGAARGRQAGADAAPRLLPLGRDLRAASGSGSSSASGSASGGRRSCPDPGDYMVCDVAGESVLVVRTRDGGLAAHYNVCRHRGSQLVPGVRTRKLRRRRFAAPITPGPTRSRARCAPRPSSRRATVWPKDDLSLHPVGVESWGGFVFLNLTPARSRADRPHASAAQLGGVPDRLRRYPLAELRVARRIEYEVAANWKVMLENYNECYHCGPVHPSSAAWCPPSSSAAAPSSTGSGASRTVRAPGPSPAAARPTARRSRA